jgi:hypothetical protein
MSQQDSHSEQLALVLWGTNTSDSMSCVNHLIFWEAEHTKWEIRGWKTQKQGIGPRDAELPQPGEPQPFAQQAALFSYGGTDGALHIWKPVMLNNSF